MGLCIIAGSKISVRWCGHLNLNVLCGQQGGPKNWSRGWEAPAVGAAQLQGPCWLMAVSCPSIPRVLLPRLSIRYPCGAQGCRAGPGADAVWGSPSVLDGLLRPAQELLEDVVLQAGLAPQPGV